MVQWQRRLCHTPWRIMIRYVFQSANKLTNVNHTQSPDIHKNGHLYLTPWWSAGGLLRDWRLRRQPATGAATRDKTNLKRNSILEEHMIEKCIILVDDTAQHMGPPFWTSFFLTYHLVQDMSRKLRPNSWTVFCTNTLRKAEDLMPRDIMSSKPRHWMVFDQLVMAVQRCFNTALHSTAQHRTAMASWPNTIQCLGSDSNIFCHVLIFQEFGTRFWGVLGPQEYIVEGSRPMPPIGDLSFSLSLFLFLFLHPQVAVPIHNLCSLNRGAPQSGSQTIDIMYFHMCIKQFEWHDFCKQWHPLPTYFILSGGDKGVHLRNLNFCKAPDPSGFKGP